MPVTVDFIRDAIKGAIQGDLDNGEKRFKGMDAKGNNDGKLTKDDFKNERAFAGIGRKYNTNNDDEITLEEYLGVIAADALRKKLDIETYDQDGEIGSIECSDFRRMIEVQLGVNLENEDEGALTTILAAINTSGNEGVAYPVFKTKLYEMYSQPDFYGSDDASKALLEACQAKLNLSAEQTEVFTTKFEAIDKTNNGVIDVKDFTTADSPSDTDEFAAFVEAVKKCSVGGEEKVTDQSFVSKREYLLVLTLKEWDAIMKEANGSLPTAVTKEVFLKFLTKAGVSADDASVKTVYNRLPAAEFSVEVDAFNLGMAKFITGSLLA